MEDFRVTQTGDEIQEILNQSPIDTADIAGLKEADALLDGRLEVVEGKIPVGASAENPLTDKQYVDSSISEQSETFNSLLNEKADTADVYQKTDTYSKEELDSMITTPNVQYVTVTATSQTTSVTDLLPATGSADTIYRVGSWDGSQYDASSYAEYVWNGSAYVLLSVRNVGIDSVPTEGSENLVQSGGVYDSVYAAAHPYYNPEVIQTGEDLNDYGVVTVGNSTLVKNADNSFTLTKTTSSSTYIYIGLFDYDYTVQHYLYADYDMTKTTSANLVVRSGKTNSDTTICGSAAMAKGSGVVKIKLSKTIKGTYISISTSVLSYGTVLTLSNIRLVKEIDDTTKDCLDRIDNDIDGLNNSVSLNNNLRINSNKFDENYQFCVADYWFPNCNVDEDGNIVGTSNDSYLRIKQVSKGDVFWIHVEQDGAGGDSIISIWYSDSKPTTNSTGLTKIESKSVGVTIPVVDIEWVVDADGWIVVRNLLRTTVKFSMFKKVLYSDIDSYIPENITPSLSIGKAIISDPDNVNFGTVITTGSSSFGVSGFIDVSGGKYIGLTTRIIAGANWAQSNITGSVFYDIEQNPIQAIVNNEGEQGGVSAYLWTYYPIPNNAAYARVTVYNGSRICLLKTSLDEVGSSKADIYLERIAQAKYTGTSSGTLPALGLVHFSDFHEDEVAGNMLMNYIKKCDDYIDDVINTGDVVCNYLSNGNPTKYFNVPGLANRALSTLGNHDQAYSSGNQRYIYFWCDAGENGDGDIDTTVPKAEAVASTHIFSYNRYFKDFHEGWGVTMPTGYDDPSSPYYQACYWHKDYADQKIRLIGVDCMYRFDGILAKDGNGDFVKDGNGMLTIATDGEGLAKLTTEQETWLYDLLMDTLDSNSDAYGYSVVVMTHYPLDDLDGQCTIVDKVNTGDGTVVNPRTDENVLFCQNINSTTASLDSSFNMRNRIASDSWQGFDKGNVNNVGDIIQRFIDSNGKFVAYICGHTHYDYFYYPERYPDILCVVIDQTGNLRSHNSNARPDDMDSRLCANYYSIDTNNHWFKIVRLGLTQGKNMREKKYLCYDYVNRKVISEG